MDYFLHLTATLRGGNLQNEGQCCEDFRAALKAASAEVLRFEPHCFHPQGLTAVAVLSESHASIHTWPEANYAMLDYFTCSPGGKMQHDAFLAEWRLRGYCITDQMTLHRSIPEARPALS